MESKNFDEVLKRASLGDPRATAELMQTYGPHVRQVARARLKPFARRHVDSEDVQQSVFRRFFNLLMVRKDATFDSPEHLAAYLAKAARNKTKDHHRNIKRQERGRQEMLPEEFAAMQEKLPQTPELWLDLLGKMSAEEREVAQWRVEGYTWNEIAQKRGVTLMQVYQPFMRCLQALVGG